MMSVIIGANSQLFGWPESTWLWLDQVGILGGDIMLLVTVLGGLLAWLSRDRIRRWLRRDRFPVSGDLVDDHDRWDALLFTVSHEQAPQWVIDSKQPAAVGLLATGESRAAAEKLADHAHRQGIETSGPHIIADPDDPVEARDQAVHLIKKLRAAGHERIGVDVTGGKTPMSIGAFMAAREQGCEALYVATRFDKDLNRPDMSSARIISITRAE